MGAYTYSRPSYSSMGFQKPLKGAVNFVLLVAFLTVYALLYKEITGMRHHDESYHLHKRFHNQELHKNSKDLVDPNIKHENKINIVFSVDDVLLSILPTALSSIWKHTSRQVRTFIVFPESRKSRIWQSYLTCFIGDLASKDVHFLVVNETEYVDEIFVRHMTRKSRDVGMKRYSRLSNYIRFYLQRILPSDVKKIIYLDVDILAIDDIGKLWDLQFPGLLAGVLQGTYYPTSKLFEGIEMNPGQWAIRKLQMSLNESFQSINAGIFVMNMEQMRQKEQLIMNRLFSWAEGNTKYSWYMDDTQPLTAYAFYGEVSFIPLKWNIGARIEGGEVFLAMDDPGILHWFGKHKPWVKGEHVSLKKYWKDRRVVECTGNGMCYLGEKDDRKSYYCTCKDGYSGDLCQHTN